MAHQSSGEVTGCESASGTTSTSIVTDSISERNASTSQILSHGSRLETQVSYIARFELNVREAALVCFRLREFEQVARKVYSGNRTAWSNGDSRRNRRCATATTDIEHSRTFVQSQAIDGPAAVPLPESVRRMIVKVRRCVVRRRRLLFASSVSLIDRFTRSCGRTYARRSRRRAERRCDRSRVEVSQSSIPRVSRKVC